MPTIFRIKCKACGNGPNVDDGLAGWVTTDGRQGGQILPEGYLAIRLDSGEFKPLPHPAEESTLRGLGFTWNEAARQNRLFRVTFKICRRCGYLYEERQRHDWRTGCLAAVISVPLTVVLLKFVFNYGWGASLVGAYLSMLAIFGIVSLFNWTRWRKPNRELKLKECSKCGMAEFTTISRATGKAFMCPHCQTQNMQVTVAGIS
jgi:hypothetical protein